MLSSSLEAKDVFVLCAGGDLYLFGDKAKRDAHKLVCIAANQDVDTFSLAGEHYDHAKILGIVNEGGFDLYDYRSL